VFLTSDDAAILRDLRKRKERDMSMVKELNAEALQHTNKAAGFNWDLHWGKAPHSTKAWASSDRGWLFHPSVTGSSLGNYLDYGPDHRKGSGYEGQSGSIHCVVYPASGAGSGFARYCETVAEAVQWIEAKAIEHYALKVEAQAS
jgi:hypothetical protein